jgi:hypothetical protein
MQCVGISADGSQIWVSGERLGRSYSRDGGRSWTPGTDTGGSFIDLALSSDGSRVVGCENGGGIVTSDDYGDTWTDREGPGLHESWRSITSSANGRFIAGCAEDGEVVVSEDGGDTWTAQAALGKRKWTSIACTSDARVVVACTSGSEIFVARRSVGAAQATAAAKALSFAVSTDSGVRVRSKPDLAGTVTGRLEKGDRVELLERGAQKVKVEKMEDYWYRIRRLSDGLTGWAYGYYLKLEE